MAEIKVQVGAGLASSFKSTLQEASGAVKGMATEMQAPLLDVAKGASVTTAAFNFLGDVLRNAVLGPLGALVVSLGGVSAAMAILNRLSGLTAVSLQKFSTVEDLEGQFRPLLGTTAAVKSRLAELANFAEKTPFELPQVAAASKTLEVLTRGALSTGEGLRMVGDLAAQSGRPFEELAMWVGRLYDGLQSGRPVGEAMQRLQELGLVSGTTRARVEELQKAGKAGNEVWSVMAQEFARAKDSMDILSGTITGLRSNLEDAKDALQRAMGKSFVEQEKEAIAEAGKTVEAFTPLAAEMMRTLAGTGAVGTPGKWFPVFDTQLKRVIQTILSAKDAVLLLWKGFVVLAAGLGAAVFASVIAGLSLTVQRLQALITTTRAHIAAQAAQNVQWKFTAANIRENIVALRAHYVALGQSRVASIAMAAGMTVARTAVGYVTASLNALRAAFLNPITLALMAATAIWQWVQSLEAANQKADELNKTYNEMATSTAKQISDITTLSEKASFLAAQYAELKKTRDALAQTDDKQEIDHLQAVEKLIQLRIRQAEALNNAELKAGEERKRLLDELQQIEKDYAESKMSTTEKLISKEKELAVEQEKRAALAKAAADAEKAASAESISEIEKQIIAQQKIIVASEGRLERRNNGRGEAARIMRDRPREEAIQSEARGRIAGLQQSKEGRTATEEASKTALQEQDNKTRALKIEAEKLKETAALEQKKAKMKAAELYTEAQILTLKSDGAQRVVDEINLRQQLLALKIREAEAENKSLEAAELKNQYTENEKRILDADKDRNKRVQDERNQRMETREDRRIEQLPKQERAAALQKKQNDLNAEASTLDKKATEARKAGREGEADDLELKAEQKRAKADQYGFKAEDLLRQNTATPVVSSLAKIGGAAGESRVNPGDYAKSQLDETKKLRASVDIMKTEISGLRQDMKRPPEWDKPIDDD